MNFLPHCAFYSHPAVVSLHGCMCLPRLWFAFIPTLHLPPAPHLGFMLPFAFHALSCLPVLARCVKMVADEEALCKDGSKDNKVKMFLQIVGSRWGLYVWMLSFPSVLKLKVMFPEFSVGSDLFTWKLSGSSLSLYLWWFLILKELHSYKGI